MFICERPAVRFIKTWLVLKEAALHFSDAPTAEVPPPEALHPIHTEVLIVRVHLEYPCEAHHSSGER